MCFIEGALFRSVIHSPHFETFGTFNRGVVTGLNAVADIGMCAAAVNRCAQLIQELAGGEILFRCSLMGISRQA